MATVYAQLPLLQVEMKWCIKCDAEKPRADFPRYGRECKACESARKKAWGRANAERNQARRAAYYAEHREEINAARRKGKPTPFTPEQRRLRQLASNKRWAKTHPEASNAVKRRWEQRNKEASNAAKTAWRRAHPEKSLAYTKRRQALKKSTTVILMTPDQRNTRVWLYGDRCTYCGKRCRTDVPRNHPDKATEDHQIPLSRGGPDCGANLRLACMACNLAKRTMTVREFYAHREACRDGNEVRAARDDLRASLALSTAT